MTMLVVVSRAALPLVGWVTAVTLSVSPSTSVSLAAGVMLTAVSSVVVMVSSTATGSAANAAVGQVSQVAQEATARMATFRQPLRRPLGRSLAGVSPAAEFAVAAPSFWAVKSGCLRSWPNRF
ncbi:MAG: hypothetical protein ERJ67_04105 [Aphanocapsa feldmannii 277cV]|uniref:Uncharacterized protein n=1 Tax=Aphanocapsa feldmannii 277cV TaxID=2507553 RepID=A0A524RPC2_9CHRO|nr:MAG: hypothetical protein ERJ67_04105 [Aphanocapsa feldmannii 277cV]